MKITKCVLYGCDIGHTHIAPKKCNPILGAIGLGLQGIGSVADAIVGTANNKRTNETNMEIAQYNAEQQRKQNQENYWYSRYLLDAQNDFTKQMYFENRNYLENYNDPSTIRQKLENAGINPMFAFGGNTSNISAASSSSAPSVNAPAPTLNYQHQPFYPNFSGIGQAVNAFFQNELLNKQVQGAEIDNQIKQTELRFKANNEVADLYQKRANLYNTLQNTKNGSKQYEFIQKQISQLDNQIRLFNDTFDDLKERERLTNDVMKEQKSDLIAGAALKRSQTMLNDINRAWYPKMQQAQLDMMVEEQKEVIQRVANLVSEGELTNKKSIEQAIMNGILGIDYEGKYNVHKASTSNKGMRFLTTFTDYISSAMLKNLKLKGF